jgi:hypothetical protein
VNAPRNKTALWIVADDPLIADTLGCLLGRGYTIITTEYKEAHIETARLPGINHMTRYKRIDTPPNP